MSFLLRRGLIMAALEAAGGTFAANTANFNGVDQYCDTATNITPNATAFSYVIHLKPADISSYSVAVSQWDGGSVTINSRTFFIGFNAGVAAGADALEISSYTSGGYASFHSEGVVTVDTWHTIGITYDGSILRVYVDGTEIGTSSVSGILGTSPTSPYTIGCQQNPSGVKTGYFEGSIAGAMPYDRVLSALDMSDLHTFYCYGSLPAGLTTNLIAYHELANWTGHTGQELTDQVGSNNLTNYNSTPFTGTGLNVEC